MAAWIGPAIVAAIISALVTGMGWFVSERQSRRRDHRRRLERRTDMQVALLAEIRASQHRIGGARIEAADMSTTLRTGSDLTPFVPRQIRPLIFETLVPQIHLLPMAVIDPVVVYYQQAAAVSLLAEDMNTDRYRHLSQDRKRMVYQDYTSLLMHQDVLAGIAVNALAGSLNIQDAVGSAPGSGGGRDEAADLNS